jgi:hypothetical protein
MSDQLPADVTHDALVSALEANRALRAERDRALAERDDARRSVCFLMAAGVDRVYQYHHGNVCWQAWLGQHDALDVAKRLRWDCFDRKAPQ